MTVGPKNIQYIDVKKTSYVSIHHARLTRGPGSAKYNKEMNICLEEVDMMSCQRANNLN